MKKLALVAALVAVAIAVPLSIGSSHREAPLSSIDPTGDDTDLYAFTAEDAPGALTIVSNWVPFEDPAGGPNFYKFDDNAYYYLNIDNTGDGVADIKYLFDFDSKVRNPNSFLYGLGKPIDSINSPNLNQVQTYTLTREELSNGNVTGSKVLARNVPTPPSNVGPKTIPDYDKVQAQAVKSLPGGAKVFAGQRDDPFYASLGRIFDTINLTGAGLGNKGGGVDDLAGYAVHSTVLQLPESEVTVDGNSVGSDKSKNAVVGVWSSTERQTIDVNGNGSGAYSQISRLGNPLVNEVIIPLGQKDKFNRTTPDQDVTNYGKYVLQPELAAVLNILFDVGAPEKNRTDIVQAVLQGIPGLNAFPGKAGKNATDTLKINLGVPPSSNPDRLGVLAKDNAGYPNGRRLTDDVVDIDLQVVAGALVNNKVPLGDGVDQNDVEFLDAFPYVAAPKQGANPDAAYGSQIKALASAGSDQLPAFSASSSGDSGSSEEDDGGTSAIVWILIAVGALVAVGVAYRAGRGSGGATS
ncbi:MAG: DUF4331 domain-containing protein [Actinomycetota bacterium]